MPFSEVCTLHVQTCINEVRYVSIIYTSVTKLILNFKNFNKTVLNGSMFTSFGFSFCNIETFFPNTLMHFHNVLV